MPFPFTLPTTSKLSFQSHLISSTHPSLPSSATTQRNVLYSALKTHKRLPESTKVNNYQTVLSAINSYLPYLLTIDAALSGRAVAGEDIDIALTKEIEVEWRPTLSTSTVPGRDGPKVAARGLDYEIFSVLQTLSTLHNLISRQSCLQLYSSNTLSSDQRLAVVQTASKGFTTAYCIHTNLLHKTHASAEGGPAFTASAVDVSQTAQSALMELAYAESMLIYVLKDDPYPAILIQSRNKNDREWMIKAPEIPKLRAQVLVRLAMSAAEHAAVAHSTLKSDTTRFSKDLITYCDDLRRTARAKACRFLGIDADVSGETGKALAWLHAAMSELGIEIPKEGSKSSGLSKLKSSWSERREDKKLERGTGNWGADAGKSEEGRILEWLEGKWSKMNDTINIQLVPDWRPLLATGLPSGRGLPIDKASWKGEVLGEDVLMMMRAPPDADDEDFQNRGSSEDEDVINQKGVAKDLVGAFPGTRSHYEEGTESKGPSYF